jgi:hypothetical protein
MLRCHAVHATIALQQRAAMAGIAAAAVGVARFRTSEAHRQHVIQLEQEVARWQRELLLWTASQRRYVASLLDWIRLCHLDEEPDQQQKKKKGISPAPISRSVMRSTPMYALARSWDESLVWLGKNAEASSDALKAFADALHALQAAQAEELKLQAGGGLVVAAAAAAGDDPTFSTLMKHLCPVFESLCSFASIAVEEYGKLYQDAKLSGTPSKLRQSHASNWPV